MMAQKGGENRTELVLTILVSSYIEKGEPISSEEVTAKMPYQVSPATVRAELSKLEEEGLVLQPHVSSGRIPSYRAYRYYVDRMLREGNLKPSNMKLEIPEHGKLEAMLRAVTFALSEHTGTVSVVLLPLAKRLKIKNIHLVGIPPFKVLLIVVINADDVREFILQTKDLPSQDQLNRLTRVVLDCLDVRQAWTPLQVLTSMVRVAPDLIIFKDLILNVLQLLREVSTREAVRIHLEGIHKLLTNPELTDPRKTQHIIEALQMSDSVRDLMLDTATKGELDIQIGGELRNPELEEMAYIGAPYRIDDAIGVLSLIGPLRMNYALMFSVLQSISEKLEKRF
jgi:heat-inducible transcriptional repressor